MNKLLIAFQMLLLVFLVGCTNEAEYVGELQNGKPHGKGTITYENGGIFGLLSAQISRDAIFFGKMLGCFVFLLVVELFLFPIFVILFNVDLFDLLLIPVFVLTSLGLACLGTLASVMAINTRLRELMLPLIFLPAVIPIIIAAVTLTEMFLSGTASEDFVKWIGMIVAFDLMFLALCPSAFNYILDE